MIQPWLDTLKNFIFYDADTEFYAKVFPDSVPRHELLRVSRMTHFDLPAVLAIEKQNYLFPWSRDVFEDCLKAHYDCWVCKESGRILGYCLMTVGAGEAHILNISVDPNQQRKGIGRKMLTHLFVQAKAEAETIFLEVRPSNIAAMALYEDMGFNQIGIRKNYYPASQGREDAVMLAMQLF